MRFSLLCGILLLCGTNLCAQTQITGIVVPWRSVRVAAEIEGQVVFKAKSEHLKVNAGEVILKLDDRMRKAALKAAAAKLLAAKATHERSRKELERVRVLAKKGSTFDARLDAVIAQESLDRAALKLAEADHTTKEIQLEKTQIRAPFSGYIHELIHEVGSYLHPGTFAFSLVEIDRIKIESFVQATQIRQLKVDQVIAVKAGGVSMPARVMSLAPAAKSPGRTFKVVMAIETLAENQRSAFRPGSLARWQL